MKLQKRFLIFKVKQNNYVFPSSQVDFVFKNEGITALPEKTGAFLALTVIRGEVFSCAFLNQRQYKSIYSIVINSPKGMIAIMAEKIVGLGDNFPKNAFLLNVPDLIKNDFNLDLLKKEKWFHFNDSRIAKSLFELKIKLEEITERTFLYHINKDDFKTWISKVHSKELAEKVKNIKDKRELINLI